MVIRDFNGDNRREIISKTNNQLPICLTNNSHWLYFFGISSKEPIQTETNIENSDSLESMSEETVVQDVEYTLRREKLNI